jgi:hypothetical protein
MRRKCPICSSENLEPGSLRSTGAIYFRPKNTKFLTLKTADIELEGIICTDCGHVMLVAEQSKAQALVASKESP